MPSDTNQILYGGQTIPFDSKQSLYGSQNLYSDSNKTLCVGPTMPFDTIQALHRSEKTTEELTFCGKQANPLMVTQFSMGIKQPTSVTIPSMRVSQ